MEARPYIPGNKQAEAAAAEEASATNTVYAENRSADYVFVAADRIAAERRAAEQEAAKGDALSPLRISVGGIFFSCFSHFAFMKRAVQQCLVARLQALFSFFCRFPLVRGLTDLAYRGTVSIELPAHKMAPSRACPQPYSDGTENERYTLRMAVNKDCASVTEVFTKDEPPPPDAKVLLHSCCAPCSGAMFEEMRKMGLDLTIFFYNPNIHPRKEYDIRKNENKRYCEKYGVPFVDCDYDDTSWFERMKGLEYDPERIGVRCTACFDMRMEVTAKYAYDNGFGVITSTNTTSRWKCQSQVNGAGIKASRPYFPNVRYWVYNWQSDAFTQRKYEISVEERFYKQEYCGCSYSLRDSNLWRKQQGIPPVKIGGENAGLGTRYFEDAIADAEEESQEVVDQFFGDASDGFGLDDRHQKVYEGRQKNKELVDFNNW